MAESHGAGVVRVTAPAAVASVGLQEQVEEDRGPSEDRLLVGEQPGVAHRRGCGAGEPVDPGPECVDVGPAFVVGDPAVGLDERRREVGGIDGHVVTQLVVVGHTEGGEQRDHIVDEAVDGFVQVPARHGRAVCQARVPGTQRRPCLA